MKLGYKQRVGLSIIVSSEAFKTSLVLAKEAMALQEDLFVNSDELKKNKITINEDNTYSLTNKEAEKLTKEVKISPELLEELKTFAKTVDENRSVPVKSDIIAGLEVLLA